MGSRRRRSTTPQPQLISVVALILVALAYWLLGGTFEDTATVDAPPPASVAPNNRAPATRDDGFPAIAYGELPPEAHDTIELIERDGPFPFDKDGSVFQNRERLLPLQSVGYYREYTVITPGENDRGARRIVAGREGELYYTDDHYASFKRIE